MTDESVERVPWISGGKRNILEHQYVQVNSQIKDISALWEVGAVEFNLRCHVLGCSGCLAYRYASLLFMAVVNEFHDEIFIDNYIVWFEITMIQTAHALELVEGKKSAAEEILNQV